MGEIVSIAFEEENEGIKDRVTNYWTKRADTFYDQRVNEIESEKARVWTSEIIKKIPYQGKLKILDVGCGAGYFEILLGKMGHEVTGIDLTEEMVNKANDMIETYNIDSSWVCAMCMDAENLDFEDNSFDMVITRNLTWTLPDPIKAYSEWYRVLKKGGVLLNFDAEYAKNAHKINQEENIAHRVVSDELKEECHTIYHMLSVSALDRPDWDGQVLSEIGFEYIELDKDFYKRVFNVKDDFYIPDEMFMICAKK